MSGNAYPLPGGGAPPAPGAMHGQAAGTLLGQAQGNSNGPTAGAGMQRAGSGPGMAPSAGPPLNGIARPPPLARPGVPPPPGGPAAPPRPPPPNQGQSQPPSAGPSRMNSLSGPSAGGVGRPQGEIFRREQIGRAVSKACADNGVNPNTAEPQAGAYADKAVATIMQDFMRAVVRTKDHRLHATYPRAPPVWSSSSGKSTPMYTLELADEPYLAHALLVAQQQRAEREERRKRKIRMTDLAAKKALVAATGGRVGGSASGSNGRDDGGPTEATGTLPGSPADAGAPSPLPDAKPKPKTADEKAAAKAQKDAAKRAKDEAGGKKKGAKEPDVNAANRSMGTHLAGVGKKRQFAWMPGTEGGELGGTLNAKFSLGGNKRRKTAAAAPIDAPWKPGGKAGLPKLGGKGGVDATDGSRPASASASAGRIDLGAEHGSIAHLVHGGSISAPPLVDRITTSDTKATLERFIRRGGPPRQLFVRRWEEALLTIAREEQARARGLAAEVTTVFKIPACHPGDERAMKQAEEAGEGGTAGATAG